MEGVQKENSDEYRTQLIYWKMNESTLVEVAAKFYMHLQKMPANFL